MRTLIPRLLRRLPHASSWLAFAILLGVWLFHVGSSARWLSRNPLPNGLQNEILHLGNALDLWVVFQFDNHRLLHDFLFKGYWPPAVYVSALLPVGLLGPSRDAFVYVNFGWLAVAMAATYALGRRLFTPAVGVIAAVLLSFFPSTYGNMVRFEPNIALMATVTVGMWTLARSAEFTRGRWSVLFGVVSGFGMLVDRLAYAFFLWAPALLEYANGLRAAWRSPARRGKLIRHGVWSVVALLVVAGYYHSFFFAIHSEEIFSQAAAGEIIETGERTELRDPRAALTWAFYLLTLLDSQVGPALGLALLPATVLGVVLAARQRNRWQLLAWWGGALLLFTLVQKKQVFYTIPYLPGVALLAAAGLWRWSSGALRVLGLAAVLLLAGVQHQALTTGVSPIPDFVNLAPGRVRPLDLRPVAGKSPLPEAWVAPRYPQARPPDDQDLRLPELLAAVDELRGGLPVFRIGTYSDDQVFYEGYLTFFVRAANPYLRINGLMGNLQAFYEWARSMDLFIYATSSGRRWPSAVSIDRTVESFHRQDRTYPVADLMETLEGGFVLRRALQLETGTTVYFYTPPVAVQSEAAPAQSEGAEP